MHAVVFRRSLWHDLVDTSYSRMHLEIREKKETVFSQVKRRSKARTFPQCLSDVGYTAVTVCGRGHFRSMFSPPGVFNLCALQTAVPLSVSIGPAHCWSRLPLCLLFLAHCVSCCCLHTASQKTGLVLHSMPSWPSGGVSVVGTPLLFCLRAVLP